MKLRRLFLLIAFPILCAIFLLGWALSVLGEPKSKDPKKRRKEKASS